VTAPAGYNPVVVVDCIVSLGCTESSEREGGVGLLSIPGLVSSVGRPFTGSAASSTSTVGESSVYLFVVSAFIASTVKAY